MSCDVCQGRGYVFPCEVNCVEACTACGKYEYDDEAAAVLGEALAQISENYGILRTASADPDELSGASFSVVRHQNLSHYEPIDAKEAAGLAAKLYRLPTDWVGDLCCPICGGTELRVELPAVFEWDGHIPLVSNHSLRATEFPIKPAARVCCTGDERDVCNWEGTVDGLAKRYK